MTRQKQSQKSQTRQGAKRKNQARKDQHHRTVDSSSRSAHLERAFQMQQQVGNRQTQLFLEQVGGSVIQRTQISLPTGSETLYNDENAGQFTSNDYRIGTRGVNYEPEGIRYEMVRSSNRVNVNVRIKFVQQFGSDSTAASPVPEGQPREVTRDICTQLLTFWNNRNQFELVGMRQPSMWERVGFGEGPSEPTEIRLPVRFNITPVFDLGASAHATVQIDTVNAGGSTEQRVVNASHWYSTLDPAAYVGGIGDTYAHEFGHLLGIPDEYSLGNQDAHALMHRISPNATTQANMDRALDDAGVREMILAAIRPAIQAQLKSQAVNLSEVLKGQQDQIQQLVADRLRSSWADESVLSGVIAQVRTELEAAGQDRALRRLDQALRFEATDNLSNVSIARSIVPVELSPTQLGLILSSVTREAAELAEQGTITLPYQNESGAETSVDVGVQVASGVSSTPTPLTASAQQVAQEAVGAPSVGPTVELYPSGTIMNQLMAMPGTWGDLASEMDFYLNQMGDYIDEAALNFLAENSISDSVNNSVRNLYRSLFNLVTAASNAAVQTTVRNFLFDKIYPIIEQQVTEIMDLVSEEIDRHHTASGTGTVADPDAAPNPELMAAVQQMQQNARSMLNPAAPTGGGAAPQNVRYTAHTLMGDNSEGTSLRAEQLSSLVAQFNTHRPDLRRNNEDPFELRTRS